MLKRDHYYEITNIEHNIRLLKMRLYVLIENYQSDELMDCIDQLKDANYKLHLFLSDIPVTTETKKEDITNG